MRGEPDCVAPARRTEPYRSRRRRDYVADDAGRRLCRRTPVAEVAGWCTQGSGDRVGRHRGYLPVDSRLTDPDPTTRLRGASLEASEAWIERTTSAPSPTAAATRFVDPLRTSPIAKTPARVHSSISGLRPAPFQ